MHRPQRISEARRRNVGRCTRWCGALLLETFSSPLPPKRLYWLAAWWPATSERGRRGWPANLRTGATHRQTPRPTHRYTQPFIPFGAVWRLGAALWRRLIAPAGLPSSTSCASRWYHCRPVRHLLCWPQPSDGSAPAGVMAEPARLSTLSALRSASGLPPLCTGDECTRVTPVQSAAHHARTVLRSSSYAILTPDRPQIAQLRTGLCGHSERQWKETVG